MNSNGVRVVLDDGRTGTIQGRGAALPYWVNVKIDGRPGIVSARADRVQFVGAA